MDDKILKKRLRSKIAMHMLFGLGGAVVIIGALFKILHLEIGPITGGLVLGLGLGTEALIFTVAALNTGEIKEEHNDYVKKIKGGAKKAPAGGGGDEGLSSKIDAIMQEAKLDVSLMNSLASSIKGLETSAKALSPASEAVAASQNYSQELAKASTQLEQLNSSYQKQINDSQGNEDFNDKDTLLVERGSGYSTYETKHPSDEFIYKWKNGGVNTSLFSTPIVFSSGECLGGGSEINSGLLHEPDETYLASWNNDFGLENITKDILINCNVV